MNLNDIFPSSTLKSADFEDGGEMTMTISKVEMKDIGQEGQKEVKCILSFVENDKAFVLNKTNGYVISEMYGDKNVDVAWIGKPITLHVEMTTFGGKPTPGIRVKRIDAKTALQNAFWNKITELFFSPDEGRKILKENNGDFAKALAALTGTWSDTDAPAGNINPQMLIDNGISTDVPSAAAVINKLGVGGKPAAEFWSRVKLYREHRNAGKESDAAALAAVNNEPVTAK
jgi:hypothetical protein